MIGWESVSGDIDPNGIPHRVVTQNITLVQMGSYVMQNSSVRISIQVDDAISDGRSKTKTHHWLYFLEKEKKNK